MEKEMGTSLVTLSRRKEAVAPLLRYVLKIHF
jgi:hypothetical protein